MTAPTGGATPATHSMLYGNFWGLPMRGRDFPFSRRSGEQWKNRELAREELVGARGGVTPQCREGRLAGPYRLIDVCRLAAALRQYICRIGGQAQ